MKKIWIFAVIFSNAGIALSHPGHGKPGWFHAHADLLADGALIFFAACAFAGLCWSLKKFLHR